MSAWDELTGELDAWAEAGLTATLWWRDDDACGQTGALTRMLGLSDQHLVPLALAVIPGRIEPGLDAAIAASHHAVPVQHGYRHSNHAPAGQKAAEFGLHRPLEQILADIRDGLPRIMELPRALPVFVPPWNRIDAAALPGLAAAGHRGLSTFGARLAARPEPSLLQVNTHIDIIAWRRGRCYAGDANALADAIGHLRAQRQGPADEAEPTGLLTHHLDHDEACWHFLDRFFSLTCGHRAVRWLDIADVFGLAG